MDETERGAGWTWMSRPEPSSAESSSIVLTAEFLVRNLAITWILGREGGREGCKEKGRRKNLGRPKARKLRACPGWE